MATDQTVQPPKRIGELMVDAGIITHEQLTEALQRQSTHGGKVVEQLIELEYLDNTQFADFLAKQPGVASINLPNVEIPKEMVELIPAAFALKHEIIPIDLLGKSITVGMACPLDARTVSQLEEMTGKRVRPMLVALDDIRAALRKYYGDTKDATEYEENLLSEITGVEGPKFEQPDNGAAAKSETGIRFDSVVGLVRKINQLPALPHAVVEAQEAMADPDVSTARMAEVIARDPSLSAKVLQLANSPAFGFVHQIDTIERATTLLGLQEVFRIILSSAVMDYFEDNGAFDYRAFWKRSLICASACRIIANKRNHDQPGSCATAGLLHDLGRLVFVEISPENYATIDQNWPEWEVIAKEDALFGVAHPEVGYVLADVWDLPPDLCEAIRYHDDFRRAQAYPDITATVSLGALIADAYGRINRDNVRAFAQDANAVIEALGLAEKDFIGILGETARIVKQDL